MQRDDELIRSLMLDAEASADWRVTEMGAIEIDPDPESDKRAYHLILLCDAGLFAREGRAIFRLTSAGHDWLDAVRDDTIWTKTKDAAGKVGGASLGIMGAIATGYVKQKLVAFGVPLD